MKRIGVLFSKEFKDYFSSPMIYTIAALYSVVLGFLFYNYIVQLRVNPTLDVTTSILIPFFGNMNFLLLFLTPLITMRSFAEEKKGHTFELLATSGMGHLQIMAGKFLSSMSVILFLIGLSLLFPIILIVAGHHDYGVMAGGYLGVLFSSSLFVSIGIMSSALSKSQLISACVSFFLLMMMLIIILVANTSSNLLIGQIFKYFSLSFHFEGLVRGVIKSYTLVYFISIFILVGFITKRLLDARRW